MRTPQTNANPGTASWIDGTEIQGSPTEARPINTIVRDNADGELYASTNATVPAHAQTTNNSGSSEADTLTGAGTSSEATRGTYAGRAQVPTLAFSGFFRE